MEIYKNSDGVDCVLIVNENGSSWSGLKSVYDTLVTESAPTA